MTFEGRLMIVNRTPEGKQALEDAVVAWHEETGEMPDDNDLYYIATRILQERSLGYRTMRMSLGLAVVVPLALVALYQVYILLQAIADVVGHVMAQ